MKTIFNREKTIRIPMQLAEKICRYCEDKQVYNKLGNYGDFYYKLMEIIANN